MSYVAWTLTVMIAAAAMLIGWDIFVFIKTGGKPMAQGDATISHLTLTTARKYPILAITYGIAIGVLLGHLFWPQHVYLCP